ncbi:MAG TPA: glycosyltransferase family 9 protein [bacterium]|nr:glycosyltransferase family 9 protein [bacterium]HPN31428.1 glycosyltransferase family 9 protein [bacterium]
MEYPEKLLNIISEILSGDKENFTGMTAIELEPVKIDYKSVKSILIIQFSAFGDVIITNSLLDILKKKFNVSLLTYKKNSGIAANSITKIEADESAILTGDKKLIFLLFQKIADAVNSLKFDLIINLHPSEYSAVLSACFNPQFFLGQKYDASRNKIAAHFDYSFYLKYFTEYFSQLSANPYNYPLADLYRILSQIDFSGFVDEPASGKKTYREKSYNIVVCPGGKWESKLWHYKKFADLINLISDDYPEYSFFITGDVSEKKLIENIYELCFQKEKIVLNSGDITLSELKRRILESAFTITNDTSILHLSNYLNVPAILLISSTKTVPFGDNIIIAADRNCCGCMKKICPKNINCINHISSEFVYEVVSAFIKSNCSVAESLKKLYEIQVSENIRKIYYTISNDTDAYKLRFQYPVKTDFPDEKKITDDVLYFASLDSLSQNRVLSPEEKNLIINSIVGRIKRIYQDYNINPVKLNKTASELLSELECIRAELNKLIKTAIRLNEKNFNEYFETCEIIELKLSRLKTYNLLVKPYDIILYEFAEDDEKTLNLNKMKKYLEKIKISVKIKKAVAENIFFIFKAAIENLCVSL